MERVSAKDVLTECASKSAPICSLWSTVAFGSSQNKVRAQAVVMAAAHSPLAQPHDLVFCGPPGACPWRAGTLKRAV